MIKIERLEISGLANALYGMRLPLKSNDKSDSLCLVYDDRTNDISRIHINDINSHHKPIKVFMGKSDTKLANNLIIAGDSDSKWARQVQISVMINAPIYWWKEFDQYKVATTTNSESTMHKIGDNEFTIDNFSHEHLSEHSLSVLEDLVKHLNIERDMFKVMKNKDAWWQLIQLLPSSWMQKRMVTFSLQTARNIYHSRCHHKLDEWIEMCDELSKFSEVGRFITTTELVKE